MIEEDNVIDAEVVEESDNLPALIEKPTHGSAKPMRESAERPSPGRDWSTYSRPERRCTAHSSRTGEQCKNVAIKGHNVCRYHGGAAKQIKRAAQTRLDNASEIMAKQLLGIALSAESEAVKLAAVKDDALDRTIGKAPTTVEIGPTKPYEELFEGIGTMTREESRRARGVSDASDDLFAGVDSAHLHASSQEGTACQSSSVGTQSDSPDQTDHGDTGAGRESFDSTAYTGDYGTQRDSVHYEAPYSPESPMHRPRPHDDDRDRQSERPQRAGSQVRHITGDDAIREANRANRAIGALPDPLALPSAHKRYCRP